MIFVNKNVLGWLLLVSVALNLLFIGGISSRVLGGAESQPMPPNLGWIMRDLDEGTRQRLRPQMEQYGESMWPMRGRMFRAQREINVLMAQEPLDREAIKKAFAELRQANIAYQETTHEQTLGIFQQLTEAQRERALRFMSERRNPMEGRQPRPRDGNREEGHNEARQNLRQ